MSFFRAALVVGALTAASRILGLARDVACAGFFGATRAWDIFVIAFMIPNLFRHLFGEGALSSAFIPAFVARNQAESLEAANRLLNRLVGWMILTLGTITVIGMSAGYLVSRTSGDPKLALIAETTVITLPYLPLICITAILGGALNALGRFAAPAAAPVLLNLALIASAFASPLAQTEREQLWILSSAVLVGGALQLGLQWAPMKSAGLAIRPAFRGGDDSLAEVLRAFAPAVLGLAVIQTNELFDNLIAELLVPGDGAVSAIYYGNRLNQLPLGIIGFSVATAAFPALSSLAAGGDLDRFSEASTRSMRLSLWVAIPAAAGLILLAPEITALLFERGKFDAGATARTFPVVLAYAIGIPFYAANMVLTRSFYALRDMRTPVQVSLITVGMNLVMNVVLVLLMQEVGIALATSLTGIANFVLLRRILRIRIPQGPGGNAFWVLRVVISAAAGAWAAWGIHQACSPAETAGRIGAMSGSIAAAVAAFFLLSRWMRLPESREIVDLFRRAR
jgi:putative peptidoglycan lipid II flippase